MDALRTYQQRCILYTANCSRALVYGHLRGTFHITALRKVPLSTTGAVHGGFHGGVNKEYVNREHVTREGVNKEIGGVVIAARVLGSRIFMNVRLRY